MTSDEIIETDSDKKVRMTMATSACLTGAGDSVSGLNVTPIPSQSEHHILPNKPVTAGVQSQVFLANTFPELARQHAAKFTSSSSSSSKTFVSTCPPTPPSMSLASPTPVPYPYAYCPTGMQTGGSGENEAGAGFLPYEERKNAALSNRSNVPFVVHAATTLPSTSIPMTTANQLATMGIGYGPGINPNITQLTSEGNSVHKTINNPPIVNTGNNGPMYIQPGDWVCSSCGFVNWRRRRVCMRCYPFADQTEVSTQIAQGAMLAAKLAAGIELTQDAVSALASVRKSGATAFTSSASMPSTPSGVSFAHGGSGATTTGQNDETGTRKPTAIDSQRTLDVKGTAKPLTSVRTLPDSFLSSRRVGYGDAEHQHASAVLSTATVSSPSSIAATPAMSTTKADFLKGSNVDALWKPGSIWSTPAMCPKDVVSTPPPPKMAMTTGTMRRVNSTLTFDRSPLSKTTSATTASTPTTNDRSISSAASSSTSLSTTTSKTTTDDTLNATSSFTSAESLANEQDEIVLPTSRQPRRANTFHGHRYASNPHHRSAGDAVDHVLRKTNYTFSAIEPPSKHSKS